jgi:hypothetical protein
MSMPAFDTARHEIWYTDGGTGFYVVRLDNGMWPQDEPAAPQAGACPAAIGRLRGLSLGPVRLGASRARVRHAMATSIDTASRRIDVFCLRGGNLRVAFTHGKAALALTANRHYALRGVRPGARLTARLVRRLHAVRLGRSGWYLVPNGRSRGVLAVRAGVVRQVGIAVKSLTARPVSARRLLSTA